MDKVINGIKIFDKPITVVPSEWMSETLDLDSLVTHDTKPSQMTVIAVSTAPEFNKNLIAMKDEYNADILAGLSSYGVNAIV